MNVIAPQKPDRTTSTKPTYVGSIVLHALEYVSFGANLKPLALILAGFLYNNSACAYPQITVFLREYPDIAQEIAQQNPQKNNNPPRNDGETVAVAPPQGRPLVPTENPYTALLTKRRHTAGIWMTYAGMLRVTDWNGQVSFTRGQEKETLYVIVTTRISPILMNQNTIHHWELEPVDNALYKFTRKKVAGSDLFYWLTERIDELPSGKVIPLESIVIFAKPEHIYVPLGASPTPHTNNFVLPDMYVKKGAKVYGVTLYVLNLKQFFKSPLQMHKHTPTSYSTLQDPFDY